MCFWGNPLFYGATLITCEDVIGYSVILSSQDNGSFYKSLATAQSLSVDQAQQLHEQQQTV